MTTEAAEARFRRLYRQYYRLLLAYVLRRIPDRMEADDVVAECFLVLWRRLDNAPINDDEIPFWLIGIARHVLLNNQRGRQRQGRLLQRLSELQGMARTSDQDEMSRNRARSVLQALLRIDDRDREILLLAAWEEFTNGEIAAVLGCSENAAALRLRRARSRLTKVYLKENGEAVK